MALMSLAAFAQNTTVNVKLEGFDDGTKVGLILIDGDNYDKPTYEAALANGEAVLKVDVPDPRGFYVAIDGKNTYDIIALGPGETCKLTGAKKEKFGIGNLMIADSPTYITYMMRRVDRESLNKKYEAKNFMSTAYQEYNAAYMAKDTLKVKQIRQSEGWKIYEKAEKEFFNAVERQYKLAQETNRDNWIGPFSMLTNYSYLTADQLSEWEKFTPEMQQSFYGKITHDKIAPPSQVGQTKENFTFTNFDTKTMKPAKKQTSLTEVLKKSKYVLIDFWASWCKPCRAEIPNLKANYEKWHKKGFDIVSISADRKEADWLKALQEEKLPWWNDRDGNQGICSLYKVQYYPTIYLLDSEGKVIAKDIRGEELTKKLEELLK